MKSREEPLSELGFAAAPLLHDVRRIIGRVQGRLAHAVDEARAGRVNASELDKALRDADTLHAMAHDVMEALQGIRLKHETFSPAELVESALREHHREAGQIEICAERDAALPPVQGRASHFERIVGNLVRNALRHTRTTLLVSLSAQARGGADGVLLVVEDDGAGVEPALRERLFQPGVHGSTGGAGLGLAAARWAAERLGGTIALAGGGKLRGARFEVWLPAAVEEVVRESAGRGS